MRSQNLPRSKLYWRNFGTSGEYSRAYVGTAFPEFYGYEVEGIFPDRCKKPRHPAFGNTSYNAPGHFKFKNQLTIDSDGDGVMDEADQ